MRRFYGFVLAVALAPALPAHALPLRADSCAAECTPAAPTVRLANVFSDDPKVLRDPRRPQRQDGEGKIYAAIGLFRPTNPVLIRASDPDDFVPTIATAFLVSPCLVMTNYHAVFGDLRTPLSDAEEKKYSGRFSIGNVESRAVVVAAGAYALRRDQDYAVLRLGNCLGENVGIGWLPIDPLPPDRVTHEVQVAGHPGDRDQSTLWIHDRCHLFRSRNSYSRYSDCAIAPGSSGSPVMISGSGAVVAIINGERNRQRGVLAAYDNRHANIAVDMFRILRNEPAILRTIATDVAAYYRRVRPEAGGAGVASLTMCNGNNLEFEQIEACTTAINRLSSMAIEAAGRTRLLTDDELRREAIPTRIQ